MASEGFEGLGLIQRAQALTNLGNILNHIGRFVEAIEAWDRALALVPNMAMANGNRGIGLSHYAARVHDPATTMSLLEPRTRPSAVRSTPIPSSRVSGSDQP